VNLSRSLQYAKSQRFSLDILTNFFLSEFSAQVVNDSVSLLSLTTIIYISLRLKAKWRNIKQQQKQTNSTIAMTNCVTFAGMEEIDFMTQIKRLQDESCACADNGCVTRFWKSCWQQELSRTKLSAGVRLQNFLHVTQLVFSKHFLCLQIQRCKGKNMYYRSSSCCLSLIITSGKLSTIKIIS
jgi:hypothetical protein